MERAGLGSLAAAERACVKDTFEVWPDNHAAWDLWQSMDTQWIQVVGAKKLVYVRMAREALEISLEIAGIDDADRRAALRAMPLMEREFLAVMNRADDEPEDDEGELI